MKNVLILIFTFCITLLYGQNDLKNIDSNYVEGLDHKLIVKLNVDNKTDSFSFLNKKSDEAFTVTPNVSSNISISLNYEMFAFALSVPEKWNMFKIDDKLKGKTKYIAFSSGFFLNSWYQNFHFSNTKGYYVANSRDFLSGWQKDASYLQMPNYRVRKIEGSTNYILNGRRFSYRSFLDQTQIQKRSAGSFIPALNYSYIYQDDEDGQNVSRYQGDAFAVSLCAAYQYNWVISKSFHFSTGGNIGVGVRKSYEIFGDADNIFKFHHTSLINILSYNANVNYQNKKLFCGMKGIVTGSSAKEDSESYINNSVFFGVFYLGYRFDTPQFISKRYGEIFGKARKLK